VNKAARLARLRAQQSEIHLSTGTLYAQSDAAVKLQREIEQLEKELT